MTTGSTLDQERRPGGLGRLAWGLCVVAEAMAAACVVLLLAGQVRLGVAVDAYLVTNLGMVVAFGAIGGLVAGNRPGTFLFESADQGVWSRWTFVGVRAAAVLSVVALFRMPLFQTICVVGLHVLGGLGVWRLAAVFPVNVEPV